MAYTLLNAVNASLKRVNIIGGDINELTSFTDPGRQNHIDVMLQVWNAVVHELFRLTNEALPSEVGTANLTLAGQREYTIAAAGDIVASDFELIRWPLIDETNGQWITEYTGGWDAMRIDQLQPGEWTGLPNFAVISPENGSLRLDRTPTGDDIGKVYVMKYDKRFNLTLITDTFPFSDSVVDGLTDTASEVWNFIKKGTISDGLRKASFARAAYYLRKRQPTSKW